MPCLICGHDFDYHSGKWWKALGTANCIAGPWCTCEKFVPIDNLEYLEYLHDKKTKTTT